MNDLEKLQKVSLSRVIKEIQQVTEANIQEGILTLDWLLKQFSIEEILDEIPIDKILDYASRNNPYD